MKKTKWANSQLNNSFANDLNLDFSRYVALIPILIFAVIFIGFSLFFLNNAIKSLYFAQKTQKWEEIPCKMLKLEKKRVKNGYELDIKYTYKFDGKTYQSSDDFALKFNTDKRGYALFQKLKKCRELDDCFCYVNPQNPQKAVVDRQMPMKQIASIVGFLIIFFLFSLTFFGFFIWTILKKSAKKPISKDSPIIKKMIGKREGAVIIIKSEAKKSWIFFALFALFWNIVSWVVILSMLRDQGLKFDKSLIAFLFPAVGLGLLVAFVYQLMRALKFGKASLRSSDLPAKLGDSFNAVIHCGKILQIPYSSDGERENMMLYLRCEETIRNGKNSHTHELYEEAKSLDLGGGFDKFSIDFNLPKEIDNVSLPASGEGNNTTWRLIAQMKQSGIDFYADFELPILPASPETENELENEALLTNIDAKNLQKPANARSAKADYASAQLLGKSGMRETFSKVGDKAAENLRDFADFKRNLKLRENLNASFDGDTLKLEVPRFRLFLSRLFSLLFLSIFAGVGVFLWNEGQNLMSIFFFLVPFLGTIFILFSLLRKTILLANKDFFTIKKNFLFFKTQKKLSAAEIYKIKSTKEESIGNKRYYGILIETDEDIQTVAVKASRLDLLNELSNHLCLFAPKARKRVINKARKKAENV